MKNKNISNEEYISTLTCTAVIVIVFMMAMFAGGAYAITKIFHLPWYSGLALFLLLVVIWARKPKGR